MTDTNSLQNAVGEAGESYNFAGQQRKIRLLMVDDHPIVRLGFAALLGVHEHLELVAMAGSGREALALLETKLVDIVLVDLRMPGFSGIETLRSIKVVAPQVRSIVLSSFECDEEIYAAVGAGAQGYLHKEAPPEDIIRSIRLVFSGKQAFPGRIALRLSNKQMTAGLSSREREVLELVAKGLTNKDVAKALRISQHTVRNHLNHINEKLEVSDRTEASFIAIHTGLIMLS